MGIVYYYHDYFAFLRLPSPADLIGTAPQSDGTYPFRFAGVVRKFYAGCVGLAIIQVVFSRGFVVETQPAYSSELPVAGASVLAVAVMMLIRGYTGTAWREEADNYSQVHVGCT